MIFKNVELMPFNFKRMADDNYLITSVTGDFEFISQDNLKKIIAKDESLDLDLYLKLKSKFFLISQNAIGSKRALASRLHAKKSTILEGTSLHIIVVTIQCMHSCSYCQVSRQQTGDEFTISEYGFLSKHPTTGQACASPFVAMAQNYQKQVNTIWYQIFQVVREICKRQARC